MVRRPDQPTDSVAVRTPVAPEAVSVSVAISVLKWAMVGVAFARCVIGAGFVKAVPFRSASA